MNFAIYKNIKVYNPQILTDINEQQKTVTLLS